LQGRPTTIVIQQAGARLGHLGLVASTRGVYAECQVVVDIKGAASPLVIINGFTHVASVPPNRPSVSLNRGG
jgi:hypothetical protein